MSEFPVVAYSHVEISDDAWYEIVSPGTFDYWSLRAAQDILLRTDKDNAATEDLLSANMQELLIVPSNKHFTRTPTAPLEPPSRYIAGQHVMWCRSVAGPVTVIAKFFN